eukprot:CAMPEP_0115046616 /NCGR_PEP_ID=MMETSP0216-20121206/48843_1 /TAXON_ID=223996 /ORGANISM="Protocruzia adherens, Strain Boccale" /LENGTH=1396 /DNA_ID=CAMNT_0002429707 /DNA_START=26 /DNA_END=4216 /DNA_ORIENTATION=-
MRTRSLILVFVLAIIGQIRPIAATVQVANTNGYTLSYELNPDRTRVTWTITAESSGVTWAGVGFGGNNMLNIDMVLGHLNGSNIEAMDAWSTGWIFPTEDDTTNISNVTGNKTGDVLTVSFERALDTGDSSQDYVIPLDTQFDIIWAYGNTYGSIHSTRGTTSITVATPASAISDNGFTLDYTIKSDNTEITWNVIAPTTGWLSLAFGDSGSDIVYGSVSGATVTVMDAKAGSPNPVDDTTQNIVGTPTGSESGGNTTISFVRMVDTGDATDDMVIPLDMTFKLTYMYSSNNSDTVDYSNATTGNVNFRIHSNPNISGTTQLFSTTGYTVSYTLNSEFTGATWVIMSTGKWAGVGFGGTTMTNTDIAYGTLTAGVPVIKDTKASGHGVPADDTTNNFTNIMGAALTDGNIVLVFDRMFNTGDKTGDFIVPTNTAFDIVWAFGDTFGSQHSNTNRGTSSVTVATPPVRSAISDSGFTLSYTIKSDNTEITWMVTAPTTGWLSLAFGENPSDIVYGSVNGSTVTVMDAKSGSPNPVDDTTQNFVGTPTGSESGGNTTITFVRMANTGDSTDDMVLPLDTVFKLTYMYSSNNSDTVDYNNANSTTVNFKVHSNPNVTGTTQLFSTTGYTASYKLNDDATGATWVITSTGKWAGLGFGAQIMTGTDMAYGTITDGAPVVKDTKASGRQVPTDDTVDNFTNIMGTTLTGGGIVLVFDRMFETGDTTDDYMIPVNTAFDIVWAFGDTFGVEHNNSSRGTSSVSITTPAVSAVSQNGFMLSYTIKADNTEITWKVTAPTTGWVSLAFGDTGSDVIYGSVSGSTVTVKDAKSGSPNPVDDTTQNIVGTPTGSESGGTTMITFVRMVDTGDSTDDMVIPLNQSFKLTYMYSSNNSDTVDYTNAMKKIINFKIHSNPNITGTTELFSTTGFTASYKLSSDSTSATWVITTTASWAGLGFGAQIMTNTDMAYGTIKDGAPMVQDAKATGHAIPKKDTVNDFSNIMGTALTGGGIVLVFDRKLNTGDNDGDFVIPLNTSFDIAWAFGDTFDTKHSSRGGSTAMVKSADYQPVMIVRSEGSKTIGTNHSIAWKLYENDTIKFTFIAPTAGWVGLGFGSSSGMAGADFYYVNNGALVDAKGTANDTPVVDSKQHGSDFSVSTSNSVTTMSFTRELDTGDDDDYTFVPGNEVPALWAYGDTTTFGNHGTANRGLTSFTLIEKAYSAGSATFPSGAPSGLGLKFRGYDPDGTDDDVIVFEFTAPTTGWLGIGFGVSGTMVGGDIIYYGKPGDNEAIQLVDNKASANSAPTKDTTQDGMLLKYTSGTNTSMVKFARKFNTGDADDYTIQKTGDLSIIWAYGTGSTFTYHGTSTRGSVSLSVGVQDDGGSSSSTYLFLPYLLVFLLPILTTFFP